MLPTATSPGEARRGTGGWGVGVEDAVQKNEILGQHSKAEEEGVNRGASSWNITDAKAADLGWQMEGWQPPISKHCQGKLNKHEIRRNGNGVKKNEGENKRHDSPVSR